MRFHLLAVFLLFTASMHARGQEFPEGEEDDHFNEWAPSILLKAPFVCGRAKAHVEYFGLFSDGRGENYQQHYVGPGIHFLITAEIEIGTRVFWA